MSSIRQKINQLNYYAYLVNPLIPKKYRICRSFARGAHKYYDFLEESQWWGKHDLENYQNEKLQKLIHHAYNNVPYYRELFKKNKLTPSAIVSSDDLHKIPILDKVIIRNHYPDYITAKNFPESKKYATSTGGSTGEPLIFSYDNSTADVAWASFFRFLKWTGYNWGDRIVCIWGEPVIQSKQRLHSKILDNWLRHKKVPNYIYFDAFKMGENTIKDYVREIGRISPQIIRGYVSALTVLVEYCKAYNITTIKPKAVTTTAEMLYSKSRKLFEDQFGCQVFDQYACKECMGMAYECEQHSGMHITSEHCIIEFVDERGNQVEKGEKGRLVLTDLDNYAMPFIRYANGDIGSFKRNPCKCGRQLPLMDYVDGRVSDMIHGMNGNVVHGEFFTHLLGEMHWFEKYGVVQFEVVQTKRDTLEWRLVPTIHPPFEEVKKLIGCCKEYLGDMYIQVSFCNGINPTPSGKRRFTRSEL